MYFRWRLDKRRKFPFLEATIQPQMERPSETTFMSVILRKLTSWRLIIFALAALAIFSISEAERDIPFWRLSRLHATLPDVPFRFGSKHVAKATRWNWLRMQRELGQSWAGSQRCPPYQLFCGRNGSGAVSILMVTIQNPNNGRPPLREEILIVPAAGSALANGFELSPKWIFFTNRDLACDRISRIRTRSFDRGMANFSVIG